MCGRREFSEVVSEVLLEGSVRVGLEAVVGGSLKGDVFATCSGGVKFVH